MRTEMVTDGAFAIVRSLAFSDLLVTAFGPRWCPPTLSASGRWTPDAGR